MTRQRRHSTPARLLLILLAALAIVPAARGDDRPAGGYPPGHSLHGEAFDEGPRQQAWHMTGMGGVSFPVTSARDSGPLAAEAQLFFNQGVAQLHTFYYYEAERSFRQVLLLDSECAMAYWGMAMANDNNRKRAQSFIAKAREKEAKVSERERKYIEALAARLDDGRKEPDRTRDYLRGLEDLVLEHPDDIEAKAFLAWSLVMGGLGGKELGNRVAVNELLDAVLRVSPQHPGAHHYRIHLWDSEEAKWALPSALAYAHAAPGIAHAWHMPGHIYNQLSRWREAAYQQEGSCRVDHAHMLAHALMPFEIHNYAHNTHYLVANLNHMGRVRDGIEYSRNLIESPRDPQRNAKGNGHSPQLLGRISLLRLYVRYERWDDLPGDPHLDWSDVPQEQAWRAYGQGLAHLGKGDRARAGEEAARLDGLAAAAAKNPGYEADIIETARLELRGRLAVAEGKLLDGFEMLERGARLQEDKFRGDLAGYPRPFREALGLAHLEARDWGLAEANFRAVLEKRENVLVSLAGLAEALLRGGKEKEAVAAYERFLAAWHDADQDLPLGPRLAALFAPAIAASGGAAQGSAPAGPPEGTGGAPQEPLEPLGPKLWTPSPAPDFDLEESSGGRVRLADLKGKNVILVFYLGSGCKECMAQLAAVAKEKAAFESLQAKVLAVSADVPEENRKLLQGAAGAELASLPLLTDAGSGTAKLYRAYDTFEGFPLHGVVFIDRDGKIRWSRSSVQPFTDTAFLKAEVERVNKLLEARAAAPPVDVKSAPPPADVKTGPLPATAGAGSGVRRL